MTLSYYLVTYNGGTEKNLECRVYGLKEGEHYPVVRPETFSRESEKEMFTTPWNAATWWNFPRMMSAKNIILPWLRKQIWLLTAISIWEMGKDVKGWRYQYQGEYLTSWAKINDKWYLFGMDGYMLTGWQDSMGALYYLNPSDGVMMTNCTIDGRRLDGSGAYRE